MLLHKNKSQKYDKIGNSSSIGARQIIKQIRSWFNKLKTALETIQEIYNAKTFAITYGLEIALESPIA